MTFQDMISEDKLIFAVPKGRILDDLQPLLQACDLIPEADFFDDRSRKLRFTTDHPDVDIIRVRAFDVATFVAYGGAHWGVAGSDVLEEFNYSELYSPLDLHIGQCRLSVAVPLNYSAADLKRLSHLRVATKYPFLTAKYFAKAGIQAECVRLGGAMEIAPSLNLAPCIVDLVSSGQTLIANQLTEIETILHVSSRLIINRSAFKTDGARLQGWVERFQKAVTIR